MNFQKLLRTDAETGFATWTNQDASSITKGMGAAIATLAASNTGHIVIRPVGGLEHMFAGIANSDVASLGVGRFITWGYAASVLMGRRGTSVTVTTSDQVGACGANSRGGFGSAGGGLTHLYGPVLSLETVTVSTTTYMKGWVRAM